MKPRTILAVSVLILCILLAPIAYVMGVALIFTLMPVLIGAAILLAVVAWKGRGPRGGITP